MTHKPAPTSTKNDLCIRLTESVVFLRGSTNTRARANTNTNPNEQQAMLRGLLTFEVAKPMRVSSIELSLVGKTKTSWPEGIGSRRVEVSEEHEIFHASTTFFSAAAQHENAHVARRAASIGPGLHLDLDSDDSDSEGNRSSSRRGGERRAVRASAQSHDAVAAGSRSESPVAVRSSLSLPPSRTAPPSGLPPTSSAWPTTITPPTETPPRLARRMSADMHNVQDAECVWNLRDHSPIPPSGATDTSGVAPPTPPYSPPLTPLTLPAPPPLNRNPSSQSSISAVSIDTPPLESPDSAAAERGRPRTVTRSTHLDGFPSPPPITSPPSVNSHPTSPSASAHASITASARSSTSFLTSPSPRGEDRPQQRLEEFRNALQAGIEGMMHHPQRPHPHPLALENYSQPQPGSSASSVVGRSPGPSRRVSFEVSGTDLDEEDGATTTGSASHSGDQRHTLPESVPESPRSATFEEPELSLHPRSHDNSRTPSRTPSRHPSRSPVRGARTPTSPAPYQHHPHPHPPPVSSPGAGPTSPSSSISQLNRRESTERGRERRASSRFSSLLDAVVDRVRSSSGSVERGREGFGKDKGKGKEVHHSHLAHEEVFLRGRVPQRGMTLPTQNGVGAVGAVPVSPSTLVRNGDGGNGGGSVDARARESGSRARDREREKDKEKEKEKEKEKKEKKHKSTLGKLGEALGLEFDGHGHGHDSQVGEGWKEFRKGTYTYPISFVIPSNTPPSLHCDYGSVTYRLKAHVHRPGAFRTKLTASREVLLIACPSEDELESNESIVVERQWDTQMQYMIAISGRHFPVGGTVPLHMTFLPTAKIKIHRIAVMLDEKVDYWTQFQRVARADPTKRFELLSVKYDKKDGPAILPLTLSDGGAAFEASPLYPVVREMVNGNEERISEIASEFMGPGPWSIHQELHLPASCARLHFSNKHKGSNITVSHTLKIVMRVEKPPDDGSGGGSGANTPGGTKKPKLFDIVVQAPVQILDCRCNPEWTALPKYSLFSDEHDASRHSCPCSLKRVRKPTHNLETPDSGGPGPTTGSGPSSTSNSVLRGGANLHRSSSLWSSASSTAEVVGGADTTVVAAHASLLDRTALFGRLVAGQVSESGEAPPSYASVVHEVVV